MLPYASNLYDATRQAQLPDSKVLPAARYYVTMDMLRRVMEAHFGYDIEYVMNVTDIDDKIIKQARLKYLRDQYLSSTPDDSKVEFLIMAKPESGAHWADAVECSWTA